MMICFSLFVSFCFRDRMTADVSLHHPWIKVTILPFKPDSRCFFHLTVPWRLFWNELGFMFSENFRIISLLQFHRDVRPQI